MNPSRQNRGSSALLALFLVSCDQPAPAPKTPLAPTTAQAVPAKASEPRVPAQPGAFKPAFSSLPHDTHYDVDTHIEVNACAKCHEAITGEWNESTHALASMTNPFYRFAFEGFAKDAGRDKLGFCGGCHDPALLFDGAINVPINPKSEQAHAGISCNTCHGILSATTDGNGSYALSTSTIPLPKDGDETSLRAHLARLGGAKLRTNELCVSCHRGFFTPDSGHKVVIGGIDEWGPWRGSAYNGNLTARITDVKPKNCVGCHMPQVTPDQGKAYSSHRFPGGHTTLAHMTGSKAQIEAVETLLKQAATLDIAAYGVGEVSANTKAVNAVKMDNKVWLDVVIFNKNTGHFYPSGAGDLRDTWVEVELFDADGKRLGAAGVNHQKSGNDPSAHVLQALMSSEEGTKVPDHSVHDFRTVVYNHTIAPRDAAVVRYFWTADAAPKLPLKAVARLRHRRLTETFKNATCEFSKTDPAQKEFVARGKRFRGFTGDPCAPQPITELSEVTVVLDGTALQGAPAFARNYHRALGLQHHLQESLQEALDAFDQAIAVAPDARSKAMATFEKGRVLARMGRTEDAMDLFAQAEKVVGPHPAIHFARGRAYHRVFRFKEAVKWYTEASKLQDDDRIWQELAIAAGSIGDAKTSYRAAQKGLAIEPRNPHLLRNQMLAIGKLDASDDWKNKAKAAFLAFKRDERAPDIRDKCSALSKECRDGRLPIQSFDLK